MATIILFFNLQVFWEPINSIVQTLVALLLLAIFYNILSDYTLDLVISNGGSMFFIVAFISCLIPNARYKVIAREVRSQILIEKSTSSLKNKTTILTRRIILLTASTSSCASSTIRRTASLTLPATILRTLSALLL
jgi:hypothetical protein